MAKTLTYMTGTIVDDSTGIEVSVDVYLKIPDGCKWDGGKFNTTFEEAVEGMAENLVDNYVMETFGG